MQMLKRFLLSASIMAGCMTIGTKASEFDTNKLKEEGTVVYGDYTVQEMAKDVYHVHDTGTGNPSSMYVVVGEDEALLVDGSNGTSPSQFKVILDALIEDRDLTIAITHNHGDHVGLFTTGIFDLDTPIYIPADDYNDATKDILKDYKNIITLDDQDTFEVGGYTFTHQYLKGHTEGSAVFIMKDEQIVFSGDEVGSGSVWQLFTDNCLLNYKLELERFYDVVKDYENLLILPGHMWQLELDSSGNGPVGVVDKAYLEDMLKLLDEIYVGNATLSDYTHVAAFFTDSVLTSSPDLKVTIATRESYVKQYQENRKAYETLYILNGLKTNKSVVFYDYTVEEKTNNVYHIHDTGTGNPSSMYVVVGKDEALLVDGSNGTSPLQFKAILDTLVGDKKLKIAITHNHGDHVGMFTTGIFDLDTLIYIPADDYNEATKEILKDYTNIITLNDKETFKVGEYTILHQYLKGHTDGSAVFIMENEQIVFSGDEVGSGFVWQLFSDDALNKYEEGLKNLIEVVKDYDHLLVLPGHSWQLSMDVTGNGAASVVDKEYLYNMLALLDAIVDGTAKIDPYDKAPAFIKDAVMVSKDGIKCAIDTRIAYIEQYKATHKGTSDIPTVGIGMNSAYAAVSMLAAGAYIALKKKK